MTFLGLNPFLAAGATKTSTPGGANVCHPTVHPEGGPERDARRIAPPRVGGCCATPNQWSGSGNAGRR